MADDAGERTEAPTPRRRQEARRKGQVARSQDLSATVVLLAGLVALERLGPRIWKTMLAVTQEALSGRTDLSGAALVYDCGVVHTGLFPGEVVIARPDYNPIEFRRERMR